MYLISAGHAVALGPKGELYKIMSQGSHFGEVGMLLPVPRTATVRVQESNVGCSYLSFVLTVWRCPRLWGGSPSLCCDTVTFMTC